MSKRSFQTIQAGERIFDFDVMIFGGRRTQRRPLLILHSIEFPVPPSEAFCEIMWQAGLQVIFVRRAGFGTSSPMPKALVTKTAIANGATAAAEAVMLLQLIVKLELSDLVVLAVGSANPVVYRLVQFAPEIEFVIFANPMFNQNIWEVFTPVWFRTMLKQIVTSKSGLHVANQGMKLLIRRDSMSFYRNIFHKNADDLIYVDANAADYQKAGELLLDLSPDQLFYDSMMCLSEDPFLRDGFFAQTNGAVLIGANSSNLWRSEMQREAGRLGLPVSHAPRGDLFCAYASPETLIDLISNNPKNMSATAESTTGPARLRVGGQRRILPIKKE